MLNGVDLFKGMEEIDLLPLKAALERAQPIEALRSEPLREDHLPAQATCRDLGSGQKLAH
jgi:hypothetical protein